MANLRAIDLNLLVVLQAVLTEAHVSRAATRLAMSQPAVSNALQRARALFGDPLLERSGKQMRLTPRGQALRPQLERALAAVADLVAAEPVALDAISATVRIIVADAVAEWVVPPVLARMRRDAPQMKLVIVPWVTGDAAAAALVEGRGDLALSGAPLAADPMIGSELVTRYGWKLFGRQSHPLFDDPSLENWLTWPHLIVATDGATFTPLDRQLADMGRTREVAAVVPNFTLAIRLIARTDLVAMLPAGTPLDDRHDLASVEPPLAQEPLAVRLAWHRRSEGDRAVAFVRDAVREAMRELGGVAGV